jgi:DNA-directed RNA polymerase specialized sigma24 family protein
LPDDAQGSVTWLFDRFRGGDDAALEALWRRYLPRLLGLAQGILSRQPLRAVGADDAVQEAFVSLWRRVRAGEFVEEMRRDHLWQLLAQFTAFKAKGLVRRETAVKRGAGRVRGESDLDGPDTGGLAELVGVLPATEFDVIVGELLDQLPEELRSFAVLRLLGHSTAEIAGQLECTQRKVQRKLELVRLHWEEKLA